MSRTRAHLPLRLADEFALVAQPLLHIPRGGATYVDSGRPCYVYRGRCSARHAYAAKVRWRARPRRQALARASLSKALLCLPLAISHYSCLLDWVLLHTVVLPLDVRRPLNRTSRSKASALGSDHALVCYLLLRAPSELQRPFFAWPPLDPKCRPLLRPNALQDSRVGERR